MLVVIQFHSKMHGSYKIKKRSNKLDSVHA
jgi:hypothetical protein